MIIDIISEFSIQVSYLGILRTENVVICSKHSRRDILDHSDDNILFPKVPFGPIHCLQKEWFQLLIQTVPDSHVPLLA